MWLLRFVEIKHNYSSYGYSRVWRRGLWLYPRFNCTAGENFNSICSVFESFLAVVSVSLKRAFTELSVAMILNRLLFHAWCEHLNRSEQLNSVYFLSCSRASYQKNVPKFWANYGFQWIKEILASSFLINFLQFLCSFASCSDLLYRLSLKVFYVFMQYDNWVLMSTLKIVCTGIEMS